MSNNSSVRLDEAMASEMANLSLSDLDSIRSVMALDRGAVKDEVITDLVTQCLSNQKKLMKLVNSTGDEELLGQGLILNDCLQAVLTKHDDIASGSPLPTEASGHLPGPSTPAAPVPALFLLVFLNWKPHWMLQNEIDNILSKPIIPIDLYKLVRDSQLVGLSGFSREGLPVFGIGVGMSTLDRASEFKI